MKEVEAGRVMREQMKRSAIQKYHQVYLQNSRYNGIHVNSWHEYVRAIRNGADCRGNRDCRWLGQPLQPDDLMKRFVLALGATEAEIRETPVLPEVWDFVTYLVGHCQNNHFVYGILMICVNESRASESTMKMHRALKSGFHLDDRALEWFTVHSEADIEHLAHAKALIVKYAHEAPNFEWRGRQVIKTGSKIWTKLHDFCYGVITGLDRAGFPAAVSSGESL